jgi:hypothetical protein
VALIVLTVQGLDVPPQVPDPASQVQPLAARHVVCDVLMEHGCCVPTQVAVEDHVQPLAERHVVLIVLEGQVVGVPEQAPEPGFQVQPLLSPPLDVHSVLAPLVAHAAGVPEHVAVLYVQPLFWHVVWLVFAAQVVVGVPMHMPAIVFQVQPAWYPHSVELVRSEQSLGVPVHVAAVYVQPVCPEQYVELVAKLGQGSGVPLQLGGTRSAHAQPV